MIKKTVFVGTPEFSVPTLFALINSDFKPELVITQPDRPKGRKLVLTAPPVKELAIQYGIDVIQPDDINNPDVIAKLQEIQPDIIITISYGGFIGKVIRKIAPLGVINIHPSILPMYRGSTPIQTALLNGDQETAVTIFKIIAKMDAGPILYQKRYPINPKWNYTTLEDFLSQIAGHDLISFLEFINTFPSIDDYLYIHKTQPIENVSYTTKVTRETLNLDWNQNAVKIHHLVRSYSEIPAVYTFLNNHECKIIETQLTERPSIATPGTITDIVKNWGLYVATKDYDLFIKKIQKAGKRIMDSSEFINGTKVTIGDIFNNGL